jgi:hypothetical protein
VPDLARRRSQTNVSAGARMAKTVLFRGNWWARTWATHGPKVVLWVSVLFVLPRLCFALGNPTDLQAVEPSPDDISAAARYFDDGRSAFKQERYVEAAEAFEKADALAPNAKVLLLAIQSRELGGHLARAATLAALATQRHPKDELFADVGQLLKIARTEFNFVTVFCDDPCQVMVGNRLLHGAAATRRFLYLEQGKYRIRATWNNGKSLSKYYEAAAGRKGSLKFEANSDAASTVAANDEGAAPSATTKPRAAVDAPDDTSSEDPGTTRTKANEAEELDDDYWADGEGSEDDPPDDPFAASGDTPPSEEVDGTVEQTSTGSGLSPLVFWIGAGTTVVLAGVSTWSGIDTLSNPGKDAVVRECVGQGINCPTYQQGLRNQDRTNILWTVTASVGALSGLIGWLWTDWDGDTATSKQQAVLGGQGLNWQLQPLLTVDETAAGRRISISGSYVTATGRF